MIDISGLSKRYGEGDSAVVALEDIDVGVDRNEFVSIVGPSGCGKTTLLHIVGGLIEPTSGTVEVDGTSVASPDYQKTNAGLVFQHPVLLEWRSVMTNIMLPIEIMRKNGDLTESREHYERRAEELLELVGLEGFEDSYPGELSGGMQQRVTICQSLIHDPNILLMDEPFGSLDALTKDHLNEQLLEIWRETEKTILFVTHDLEEAVFLSDRVLVMSPRPGQMVGNHEVDIPRPRTQEVRQTEAFNDITADIYEYFR